MSAIDWSTFPPPWNKLGPEMADYVARTARGELLVPPREALAPPAMMRCDWCGSTMHVYGIGKHRKHCKNRPAQHP